MVCLVGWDGRVRIPVTPDVHHLLQNVKLRYGFRSHSEAIAEALRVWLRLQRACRGDRDCVSKLVDHITEA